MDVVKELLQKTLPNYLKSLPLPKSPEGFLTLTRDEWVRLAPLLFVLFFHLVVVLSVLLVCALLSSFFLFILWLVDKLAVDQGGKKTKASRLNTTIKLNEEKVVDIVSPPTEKTSYCRCWKSKKVR
jgi:hypothetical protein